VSTNYRGSPDKVILPSSWQELGRLVIRYQSGEYPEIQALFNPNRLTLRGSSTVKSRANTAQGKRSASLSDYSYEPLSLSVSLFFDTSEAAAGGALASLLGAGGGNSGSSVLAHTTAVAALLRPVPGQTRPPICELWWGRYQILCGVLSSLSQSFTHFLADGTPVRATLDCEFREVDEAPLSRPTAAAVGVTRQHIVGLGETLQSIAVAAYGNAARWRDIAVANNISNPRAVFPGRPLKIPP
jgi:nucleoid-associated protein YgaU